MSTGNIRAAVFEAARSPWLRRLGSWDPSICSLLLGLLTLFVFRRGLLHVGWIVGYSTTRNLQPPLEGGYAVDVVTASGQLIGRVRFTVTP